MTAGDVPGGDDGRALYGLDPGEFTAARNDLSKRLKAAGDKDGAAAVAKLRKPPVTAWALNAVARRLPGVIDAVLDAGAGLRAATENALSGDASGLRTAQAWERRAVDAAVTTAAEVLADAGHGGTDTARQRMAGTLRAAMVDSQVAEALRGGVLDDDRDAPGFGLDAFSALAAGSAAHRRAKAVQPAPAPGGSDPDEQRRAAEVAAAKRAAAAERTAKRMAGEAAAAQSAAEKAQAAAAKARADADAAAARATTLEQAAADARATAGAAMKAAQEAAALAAALQDGAG